MFVQIFVFVQTRVLQFYNLFSSSIICIVIFRRFLGNLTSARREVADKLSAVPDTALPAPTGLPHSKSAPSFTRTPPSGRSSPNQAPPAPSTVPSPPLGGRPSPEGGAEKPQDPPPNPVDPPTENKGFMSKLFKKDLQKTETSKYAHETIENLY